jgi:rRNA small subunit pseudouridine methyltransferase Nep1
LESFQLSLLESRSLRVGYRFFVPQSKQVINTVVPTSDLVLTRQFTPGTRKVPQPLQIDIFCSLERRTPAFIPTRRASSTYRFDRFRSVENALFARSSRISIRSRAISRILPLLQANERTELMSAKCSCNLFCRMTGKEQTRVEGSMGLTLALVESALQLIPEEIRAHPEVRLYAKRRRKLPEEVLLDRGFHNAAMRQLARTHYKIPVEKMGRPDIVHNTLLQVLETPLNWQGQLRTFVHTQDNHVVTINPKVRLPKNYVRFVGLIEQLFAEGRVPRNGQPLLSVEKMSIRGFLTKIRPSKVLGFSILGKPMLLREAAQYASRFEEPLVFVGGFPRGHFDKKTRSVVTELFRIDARSLDAWIVAGRFVYDFEWSIGLAKSRLRQENVQGDKQ